MPTIGDMIEMLKALSSADRLEVFAEFCTYCGDEDPPGESLGCQCWNDE